ncbi:hypothetical protein ADEAN_000441700 [Angomonas deanei]|uniref:Uncharacterized protein n=1 Tax=Angomonas deanei TaxID=59799 RepID=A0A7G2CBP9_9TRYP|nr:hypothetical protein ADEAN_000441700 [Angomonas deanei]
MNPDRPTAESKSYSPNILLQQRVEQLLSAPIDQCFQNNTDGANFIATLHYVDCILQKENNNSNADFRFLLEQEQLQNHKMLLKTVSDMYQECITTSESLASLVRNVDRVESLLFTSQTNKEEEIKKQSEFAAKIKVLSGALKQSETEKVQVEQFQEKYNFGEEDQEKIEKDRISPSYLALYEKLEVIYDQSKDQLLRPTAENNNDNTTTFLETAFGALRMARERIRQYVLDATMYNTDGVNITADLPHLPPLYTRCVVLLKKYEKERIEQELLEETNFLENNNHNNYPEKKKVEVSVLQSKSPLQRIIEEVIKQRKKTVLRRFFQLLMTGVTSTGTSLQNDENENNTIKPLETEIDHPVTFFSELFAFVYQTAVTEEDFMALYTRDDNPKDTSL